MLASRHLNRRVFLLTTAATPSLALLQAGCASAGPEAGPPRELVAAPAQVAVRGAAGPAVSAWTYGGTVPGPEIRLRRGERLRVVLDNRLPQDTTVHWHGVRVPNAMDGVPHLTQPPVRPGERFVYEFDLPDAGTYWYHSHLHSAEQLDRGLYGPLIVEELAPPRVDRELTWVLDDWRLMRDGRVNESFGNAHDMAHAGRIGNVVNVNGVVAPEIALRAGERIRLRLINAANARIFALQFDGHRPQVIALDGQPVAAHEPARGSVVLAPGMRCDLVLDAVGRAGQRFAVGDVFSPRAAYDLLQLVYAQQPLRPRPLAGPVALPPNPLSEPDLAGAQEHEIRFEGGMMGTLHQALLDGRPSDMMSLLRAGKAWAVNGVVAGGHRMAPMMTLARGSSHVLRMRNDTRWFHPIHLHGHAFRVLSRNGQPTAHREWQDTVLMAPQERVDIAFVADNPGDWMLHCHVLEHQEGGMMGVVRVA
jgi:FtsP/CotA-like multicopper oxidase with cupredoxin domain